MIHKLIRRYSARKLLLFAGDSLVLLTATFLALCIRHKDGGVTYINPFYNPLQMLQYGMAVLVTLVSFRYMNLYKPRIYLTSFEQLVQLTKAILFSSVLLMLSTFFIKISQLETDARLHLILFSIFNLVFIYAYRLITLGVIKSSTDKSIFRRRALAIGAGEVGKKFAALIQTKHSQFISLVGFIDDDKTKKGEVIAGVNVVGTTSGLQKVVEEMKIDEIFITIESIPYEKLLDLVHVARETHCQVNLISSHYNIIDKKVDTLEFKDLKSVPIFTRISPFYSEYLKRILDLVISGFTLLIIFPFLFILIILVKMTSKGPAFYKAAVVGQNGKQFYWYKLRSMYIDNRQSLHKNHLEEIIKLNKTVEKIKDDPRITPVGKFIRKYSLDELPQLINVVKGDMSLVGPRPCLPYEFELMDEWQRKRFNVTPGLTGLWQIAGRNRSDVNFNDSVILDLYYSDNISFWFDMKILFKTIPVVIFGKGGS